MRTFSRHMPSSKKFPQTQGKLFPGVLVFALVLVAVAAVFVRFPILVPVAVCAVLIVIFVSRVMERKRQRRIFQLVDERVGESICNFARSFDRREIDPWVVRAVYEECFRSTEYGAGRVPVRRGDALFRGDLQFDEEDFEIILSRIAFRCRRSLDLTPGNPLLDANGTIGDIVAFLDRQPRLNAQT